MLFNKARVLLHDVESSQVNAAAESLGLPMGGPGVAVDMLLIDRSGSMAFDDYPPSRLEGAKQATSRFLRKRAESEPEARVGIISFSASARVVQAPVVVHEDLWRLECSLPLIVAEGATNTAAGLRQARSEIERIRNRRNSRILLLTDGHATAGTNPVEVAENIKANGIHIEVVGIGGTPYDVNEPALKRMASVVNGELRYWFIKSVPDLVKKFEALALREIK